ncbi:MAG: cysteine hydrolase family protein [Gallionellaceae bacterium]
MEASKTALILIGYQNDYFSDDGILHKVIESSAKNVLSNTLKLLENLSPTPVTIISTPIFFTPEYSELVDPIGILKVIRDVGAFKKNSHGAATIDELAKFGDRIITVEGKRGLNAFHDTELESVLRGQGIKNVVLAGVVTSICIDSTARSAFESGFSVSVLSDCTAGRTEYEQQFYCKEILPLYTKVTDGDSLTKDLL